MAGKDRGSRRPKAKVFFKASSPVCQLRIACATDNKENASVHFHSANYSLYSHRSVGYDELKALD